MLNALQYAQQVELCYSIFKFNSQTLEERQKIYHSYVYKYSSLWLFGQVCPFKTFPSCCQNKHNSCLLFEEQSNYMLFNSHWIYLTLRSTMASKKNPDKTNYIKGFKVKRWNASWADERRVSKPRSTLFWEMQEKSKLSSFTCCPPLSCLLPCPSQIFLLEPQTQSWVWLLDSGLL